MLMELNNTVQPYFQIPQEHDGLSEGPRAEELAQGLQQPVLIFSDPRPVHQVHVGGVMTNLRFD